MKKIIIPMGILLTIQPLQAQLTQGENYIQTKTYLDYNNSDQVTKTSETVQYFDGLGRLKQIVNMKNSPKGKDVVTPILYDGFGRQKREYLPIPQSGTKDGSIYTQSASLVPFPVGDPIGVYAGESPFTEKTLESSPLNRVLQQIQAGNDWINKPVKSEYGVNGSDDYVRQYKTTTNWSLTDKMTVDSLELPGHFPVSQLSKTTVIDEDGSKTIEFRNGNGQTILVRKVLNATENADTYYIYNEYNQLAFVVPPMASSALDDTTKNRLFYQYRYDGKGRLVEKKLPGKGWEFMVYDKLDRLVLTQDANLRIKGQWFFTKYDHLSRPIYTGILDSSPGRIQQVNAIENQGGNSETRSTSSWNNSGMDIFYTNGNAYPGANFKVMSVNYYDSYPTYNFNPSPTVLGKATLSGIPSVEGKTTKGFPVLSLTKNIEDDNWTKTYTYYDEKGRSVGIHSINHLGGYTRTESSLDFAGIPQQTITRHKRLDTDNERMITENFEYDSQNRLLVHKHKVDSNPVEILSQNSYNELSQLESKKIGGSSLINPLQVLDYRYNIRGWMTQINDPSSLGQDLFGYKIKYNTPTNTVRAQSRYNGNIAEIDWKITSDNVLKRYSYQYDALNRLTVGFYSEPDNTGPENTFYNEELSYDLNGNIKNILRNNKKDANNSELIDDLTYHYTGNRLDSVLDKAENYLGYPIGGNTIGYDDNGNMLNHIDKNIKSMNYNYLNLPDLIKSNTTGAFANSTSYLYGANGTKLKKVYSYVKKDEWGNTGTTQTVTDYIDGFQYTLEGLGMDCIGCLKPIPELQFIPTSEGYFDYTKNKYIYNYTDHLGNIRVSYFDNGSGVGILEENNYYPFGLKHGISNSAKNFSYKYKYQGQELQETGMYMFKYRTYIPDIGRFIQLDPLAEKFPYNSTYAIQENKMGMGIELEGLELLKNHTGFFAIHGNKMTVKQAPITQRDSFGRPSFGAGDIGLSTSGYNSGGARISSGTGLKLDSYKYSGPVVGDAQLQNMKNYPRHSDRQRPTTTKTKAEMWNLKQVAADKTVAADLGVREIAALINLGANIPGAIKSSENYVNATNDVKLINSQAKTMDRAIQLVDQSGIEMTSQTRNDVVNYVFDGTLPNPGAGMMPNSLIIQNGTQILRDNKLPIQPLDEQLTTKNRSIPQ